MSAYAYDEMTWQDDQERANYGAYPEGAYLTPYDRDLPYELQADDEAAAELMQGESPYEEG